MPLLTAEHIQKLKDANFTDPQIADVGRVIDVSKAMTFNWQQLLQDILTYGPQIVAVILSLFGLEPTPPPPGPSGG